MLFKLLVLLLGRDGGKRSGAQPLDAVQFPLQLLHLSVEHVGFIPFDLAARLAQAQLVVILNDVICASVFDVSNVLGWLGSQSVEVGGALNNQFLFIEVNARVEA